MIIRQSSIGAATHQLCNNRFSDRAPKGAAFISLVTNDIQRAAKEWHPVNLVTMIIRESSIGAATYQLCNNRFSDRALKRSGIY